MTITRQEITDLNHHLIIARFKMSNNNRNDHNDRFENLARIEAKKFLLSLTGNEPFYSTLFKTYNDRSVFLDIDEIIKHNYNCYDLLVDFTSYYKHI